MAFEIDVACRLGDHMVSTRFTAAAPLVALFGPSGAGKTSVLNMVAGLLRPDRGRIAVDGEVLFDSATGIDLAVPARRAGYVFQDDRLFPHLRVQDNLLYGWKLAPADRRRMTVDEACRFLDIGHLLGRWPRTLSGGEARRVAIGRALLSGARFLLMDEPLTSLDRARCEEILRVIERLRDELGLPVLYVSHDRAEVERLTPAIIAMERA
ncbi:MAG TPA: ATP-binding cassette domain-containing protein [Novosphingobium sp.]